MKRIATENVEEMDLFEEQHFAVTQVVGMTKHYIGVEKKLNDAVKTLKVPAVLKDAFG